MINQQLLDNLMLKEQVEADIIESGKREKGYRF